MHPTSKSERHKSIATFCQSTGNACTFFTRNSKHVIVSTAVQGSDSGMLSAELDDDIVHNAKMLKRMQVLEEKGTDFATRPLRSLPVIGDFPILM